jgi:hypothetical protein
VATTIGACTTRDRFAYAVRFVESVTIAVKGYVFVLFAGTRVPLIKPDVERVRFSGSEEPDCRDQAYPLPPVAFNWLLKGCPQVAVGSEVVVICSGARTVIVTGMSTGEFDAAGAVTVIVALYTPAASPAGVAVTLTLSGALQL